MQSLNWFNPHGADHAEIHHINIQEMVAFKNELLRRGIEGERDRRIVFINDSRVVVGAVAKGRSSSIQLNFHLRKLVWVRLAWGLNWGLLWTGTKANPADAPSRHLQLPKPTKMPAWLVDAFGKSQGRTAEKDRTCECREYFAGFGGLSEAINRTFLSCQPFEAHRGHGYQMHEDLERQEVIDKEIELMKKGEVVYGHFGVELQILEHLE